MAGWRAYRFCEALLEHGELEVARERGGMQGLWLSCWAHLFVFGPPLPYLMCCVLVAVLCGRGRGGGLILVRVS